MSCQYLVKSLGTSPDAERSTPGKRSSVPPAFSPPNSTPAQIIVYGPGAPTVLEGTAVPSGPGSIELVMPVTQPPAAGTTVQIILYGPGAPTVIEGTTSAPAADGSFEIVPVR